MFAYDKKINQVADGELVIDEKLQCVSSNTGVLIAAIVIPIVVVLIAVLCCYYCWREERRL